MGQQRKDDERDQMMTLAWHVAALSKRDKVPRLETLLTKRQRPVQTVREQRAMLDILAQQYGLTVRKRGR